AHEADGVKHRLSSRELGKAGGELGGLEARKLGGGAAEEDAGEDFVLRQGGGRFQRELRIDRRTRYADAGGDVVGDAVGGDVDAREADGAIQRDRACVEIEASAAEVEAAAHHCGGACDGGIGDGAGDTEVCRPFRVEA